MDESKKSRVDLYTERAERFGKEAEQLGARSRLVSNLRGVAFASTVIPIFFVLFSDSVWWMGLLPVGALAVFIALVVWHARVIAAEGNARRWERVNQDARARCSGRWRDLPDDGAAFSDSAHPFSGDLDVFGKGSVFQRICTAHTHFGQGALAKLLADPSERRDSVRRQEAVRALESELEMRQRLEALSFALIDVDETKRVGPARSVPDPEPLLRWAEGEPKLGGSAALVWAARIMPVVTLGAITAAAVLSLPAYVWVAPIVLQVAIVWRTRDETTRVFTAVSSTEGAFMRYGPMLELLENVDVDSELLKELRETVLSGEQRPSASMGDFQRRLSWFEVRHNGLIHPFVNGLLLWDVHCVLALEGWQRRSGKAVRKWFTALGQLEALSSLAGLAHDEPDFAWPELVEDAGCFRAEELGHPLIDGKVRVANDVDLAEPGTALLVTGSNMSGKSTLLRAMGLAVVLASAGGPVCAKRLRVSHARLRTSVRISDSLEHGVSHFYAELRKIKAVLDATVGGERVFFLLDEVLHGTNSRERQIGARWVLAQLLERGAIGAVSTHDMGLCQLEGELMQRVKQVHFRESVKDDEMTFDFKLREGPVTAGNALRLMRLIGIDVPLE